MCRLTEKNKKFACTECLNCMEGRKIEDQYYKLQELEDIEEEIGIDLVTLFKAYNDGFYYLSETDAGIEFNVYGNLFMSDDHFARSGEFYFDCWKSRETIYVKDYGKTWALTKEELLEEEEC